MQKAIFGAGCFWGPEEKFSKITGITKTEVGYCGGNKSQTTYEEVCTGQTNHAEVVKIEFDGQSFAGRASLVSDDSLCKKISKLKYDDEKRANEPRVVLEVDYN